LAATYLREFATEHIFTAHSIWFLQRVRIARSAHRCNSQRIFVCPSVCLSVRSSVTFRCFVQTNEDTIVRSSASGKTIILVSEVKRYSLSGYSQGITPSEGVKVRHSPVSRLSKR